MNRRSLLVGASRALQACIAGAIAIPGVRYICSSLRSSKSPVTTHQRVARLQDLRIGQPLQVAITGRKQDGWSLAEMQVIGRIWLVRQEGKEPQVEAFNTICPHMGCQIQVHPKEIRFLCPCHRATFGLQGEKLADSDSSERNHAPRDMDALDCRIVQDESSGESWVEVKYERFESGLTKKIAREGRA
jgi:Rieske Fe-S protein